MDEQNKPRSRVKKVVNTGKGLGKKSEGTGTGPVNNTGNYAARQEQERARQQQAPRTGAAQSRPQQAANPFAAQRPQQQSRPQQAANPFGTQRPQQSANPFAQRPQQSRPQQSANPFAAQRPQQQSRPQQSASSGAGRQYNSAVKQSGAGGGSGARQNGTRAAGGGGGKLILILIVLALLFFGGKFSGLFGGGNQGTTTTTQSQGQNTSTSAQTQAQQTTTDGKPIGGLSDLLGGSSSSGGLGNLLGGLFSTGGSSGSVVSTSPYDTGDFSSLLSSLLGGGGSSSAVSVSGSDIASSVLGSASQQSQYFTSSSGSNTSSVDTTVSKKAREKYTKILGNNKDTVTILVYLCGADLESQQGMGTSDLKEMAAANTGKNVNLIVYTGGASRWRNNVISSRSNQIYQIKDGAFYCLEQNMGTGSMTSPETLASFIKYGKENFSANRMCLIFWDHGGGSVSGYGYDERYGHNQTMTLAGIDTALKNGGVKFDFIGFDTCLMATVENGLMLSDYADYMIASEETEPGVGWYYTNWLTKLGKNPSMSTLEIGKTIVDDFVEVCNQKCRGQGTTLSVVDLAELEATIPAELKDFSVDTCDLIKNKQYKTVSTARSKTREFAQSSKIDQIDLVHFATNMGTDEGKSLAKALKSAIKYNRTGGGISNAYGLSIYFPYKRTGNVNKAVSTYKAIGMDEEYTRCIQEFASLEVSGQVSAGTPISSYGSYGGGSSAYSGMLGSLLGGGSYQVPSYSSSGVNDLLGGLFGGGSSSGATGSILDLFMNRSLTQEEAAEYIMENHFDADALVWQDGKITLTKDQWGMVVSLCRNVFFDDGEGYVDLGMDPEYQRDGDSLVGEYDGTWLSINGQIVAFYYLSTVEEGDNYVISGYVPAVLNGEQVNLILNFDSERPDGYIAGAQKVYEGAEDETQAKELIAIGEGDKVGFLFDYYDYKGNFKKNVRFGDEMTLGANVEIANTPLTDDLSRCRMTYCFTDIYQQPYWTPTFNQ